MVHELNLSRPSSRAALQLAAFMARPSQHIASDVLEEYLIDVNGYDLRPFLQVPELRERIEAYIAKESGSLDLPGLDGDFLKYLALECPVSEAIAIGFAPPEQLEIFYRYIVAAICQHTIARVVQKAERIAIATLLGADIQNFAIRKAAMFYASLEDLSPLARFILTDPAQPGFSTHPSRAFAINVVAAALDKDAPAAGAILRARAFGNGNAPASAPISLKYSQAKEIKRLWYTEVAS